MRYNLAQNIKLKNDFTSSLGGNTARYIVSVKNIYTGKNPTAKLINKQPLQDFDSIGGWKDKKTGKYYLDLNLHFARLNRAIQIGKALNQIAIFDRKLKKVINLK